MTTQDIDERAENLLREHGVCRVPVPIDVLAHRMNLTTEAAILGVGVSGVLVVENNRGAIGYNAIHALVRQRFTIAHEVAHYALHVNAKRRSQVFIDKFVVYRRDENSSNGTDRQEVEANRLGAALLMPKTLLIEEINKQSLDLDDEDDLVTLSKKFQVSTVAMANRLKTIYPH